MICAEPPFFLRTPVSELVVEQGDYFTLECEAYSSGSLITTLEWQREDSETLMDDERVTIFSDGTLLVGGAKVKEDSGTYSCVATNLYGNSTASSHVIVLRKFYYTLVDP